MGRWVRSWHRRLTREPVRLARVVRTALPAGARILTLSRGASLRDALIALPARRRPSEVFVLESRPEGEGRRLSSELRAGGLRARWVPDGSLRDYVRRSDLVLLGADAVEPDGALIHKVGTRALAREAAREGVPVVVVAGRSKWRPRSLPRTRIPPWFDRTPAGLIGAYWTDVGVRRGRSHRAVRRP